jgi:predicted phosphodiesterase
MLIFAVGVFLANCKPAKENKESFSFVITADMRNFTGDSIDHYRGACEAINELDSFQFIVSPGDIDPPDAVLSTMQKYIRKDLIWYPVVGNHEAETTSDMEWLRNYNKGGDALPYIVNKGPLSSIESTYSFDYGNTHFVILNQYSNDTCDNCTAGDVPDVLYHWLQDDLQKTAKKNIFVLGHEPAYPLPDIENQRYRHTKDCLNQYPENRDRFVKLLQDHQVRGYIVGHTHNYSIAKINSLWHIDVGHARGLGDTGARSTFVNIDINNDEIAYQTYRLNYETGKYDITDTGRLD